MNCRDYFSFIADDVHTTILATVGEDGKPYTAAVDMMDYDEQGLYFLTAKGKSLYRRLKEKNFAALTALKGEDTMHSRACSVRGEVEEVGPSFLPRLFAKNPYMADIYPTEESRKALTVLRICRGTGEWFDLSKLPIERADFSFGTAELHREGFEISADCTGCGACAAVCPQNCIDVSAVPAVIRQENCLHCGNCFAECPAGAVIRL